MASAEAKEQGPAAVVRNTHKARWQSTAGTGRAGCRAGLCSCEALEVAARSLGLTLNLEEALSLKPIPYMHMKASVKTVLFHQAISFIIPGQICFHFPFYYCRYLAVQKWKWQDPGAVGLHTDQRADSAKAGSGHCTFTPLLAHSQSGCSILLGNCLIVSLKLLIPTPFFPPWKRKWHLRSKECYEHS